NGVKIHRAHDSKSPNTATIVVCENGYVDLGELIAYDNQGNQIKKFEGRRINSIESFIKAVRSRKQEDIKAPILEGHLSASICHMGNISYRLGEEVSVDEVNDVIKKDDAVIDALERTKDHLKVNGIDINDSTMVLGPMLKMDSGKEQFVGKFADQANAYVKREYREPFVIRDQV
ncbi:gfo/Idh/MocA family oxidoreductase, partial [bacterium]|nr:gfo/Idh/MocA family oxidoreductase [bacterium]